MNSGLLVWITGLAGSGKTTLGQQVCSFIRKKSRNVVFLDGDTMREIFGGTYGHTLRNRMEIAQIYCRLSHELVRQGQIVVVSTISLFRKIHEFNRRALKDRYVEILVDVSKETLLQRNQKQLYTHVKDDVMGVHQTPEFPDHPDLVLKNENPEDIKEGVEKIVSLIEEKLKNVK